MVRIRGQHLVIGLAATLLIVGVTARLSWRQFSTFEVYQKTDSSITYYRFHRWKEHHRFGPDAALTLEKRMWSIESGMLTGDGVLGRDIVSFWNPDGSIAGQYWPDYDFFRSTPPWRGDVKPRTSPCAPWVQQRVPFSIWWARLPPEMKFHDQGPDDTESNGAGSQDP